MPARKRSESDDSGHVSWKDFVEALAKVADRQRRIEIIVVILVVATASPKVGGPSPAQVVARVLDLI